MSLLGKEKPHASEKNGERESGLLMRTRSSAPGQGSRGSESQSSPRAPHLQWTGWAYPAAKGCAHTAAQHSLHPLRHAMQQPSPHHRCTGTRGSDEISSVRHLQI